MSVSYLVKVIPETHGCHYDTKLDIYVFITVLTSLWSNFVFEIDRHSVYTDWINIVKPALLTTSIMQ
jgi:hypothetical protein